MILFLSAIVRELWKIFDLGYLGYLSVYDLQRPFLTLNQFTTTLIWDNGGLLHNARITNPMTPSDSLTMKTYI